MNGIENKTQQLSKKESVRNKEQNDALKQNEIIPKKEIIFSKIDNIDDFIKMEDFINNLNLDLKSKLFFILKKIDESELINYIENNGVLNENNLNDFFYKNSSILEKYNNNDKNNDKDQKTIFSNSNIDSVISGQNLDKQKKEKQKHGEVLKGERIHLLVKNIPIYEKLFFGDEEAIKLIYELKKPEVQNNFYEIKKILNQIFLKKDRTKEFFQRLALSLDKELYEKTYTSIVAISPELESKFKSWGIDRTFSKLDTVFGVPEKEVKKDGSKLLYKDIIFDTRTGDGFILSKNGYKLEMDLQKTDTLGIKLKYQKQRLAIFEELKELRNSEYNLKYFLQDIVGNGKEPGFFERKIQLKNELRILQQQKTSPNKNSKDLLLDIQINLIQKELEKIEAKIQRQRELFRISSSLSDVELKQRLITLLNTFIFQNQQKQSILNQRLNDITMQMQNKISQTMMQKYNDIQNQAEEKRQIIQFLDNIGFSIIPQSITDTLIYEINKSKDLINLNLGGSQIETNINLSKGVFGGNSMDSLEKNQEVFLKIFNKIISGSPDEPIKPEEIIKITIKKEYGNYKNKINMIGIFEKYGIYINGNFALNKMIENVKNKDKKI